MFRNLMCLCFLFCFPYAEAQDVENSLAVQTAAQSVHFFSNQLTDYRPADSIVKAQTSGEAASPKKCFPSATKGYDGDPALNGPNHSQVAGPQIMAFGSDVRVRPINQDFAEKNQVMASDSKGNLYVAWEDTLFITYTYIQIYKSTDGGETWASYAYVKESNVNLREPSIAIGEGANDVFFLTYIRDDGVNIPVPEVASKELNKSGWTFTSVPVWTNWEGYAKPVINTDSNKSNLWFAYLTCEGIVSSSTNNINVCTWRSTNKGLTWKDAHILFGNWDNYPWVDPDASYGTTQYDLFVVCFNKHDDSVYFAQSKDSGASWEPTKSIFTVSPLPDYPVDPEIAAAVNNDNIMIACTKSYKSNDNIGYAYSTNMGVSWSSLYNMPGYTSEYEFGVSLNANEAGNSWHMAWNASYFVCYANRPQSLSTGWSTPTTVTDFYSASLVNNKKGVASVWNTDAPCVCWCDFRDGGPDYDTYVDFPENKGLACDNFKIDCSDGGYVKMALNAGVNNMNRYSLVFGSVSGVSSGTYLPGGAKLPLNWDIFTNIVIEFINTPIFFNFYGKHDSKGKRVATLNVSPFTGAPTMMINFAYAMMDPWDYASNPISIVIMP